MSAMLVIGAGITGAVRSAAVLRSLFGAIALAGHAQTARDEMKHLAHGVLQISGQQGGGDFAALRAI
ncbi:MAG: hypothetical protein GF331_19985 [Chitinivibrionales bacterium]|nr:hypothetical protein [Chitinivibrionales bacterium]